jgi:NAD kinase
MQRLTENKIVVVIRDTRLTGLKRRFNTASQAQFYVQRLGGNFDDYVDEDANYRAAIEQTEAALRPLGLVQFIDRAFLPNFVFGPDDTVVVLGQDGLVANTLKYTNGQPVLGVNPDPARFDGVLLPFQTGDLEDAMRDTFARRRPTRQVTMAKAALNDGRTFYAVNDFFIGPRSHVSARYVLAQGNRRESQSSSGIIVSTGLGSTGWLKSLLTGAAGIEAARRTPDSTAAMTPPPLPPPTMPWDADYLYFTVREPFPSRVSATTMVFGKVTASEPLSVSSQMAEHGVIFSDGIESDFLEFNSGAEARVTIAERQGKLVQ